MATKTTTKAKATKYVAKTSEEKAEQIKAMHDTIANAVANITTSEEWAAYLTFGARFYRYSFNNMMLIYINASHRGMATPTRVASFGAWAKLKHPVRKGEKGLPIFAPIIVKIKPGERGYVEGESRTKLVGFRQAYVWDVQQVTDPETIPSDPTITLYKRGASGEVPVHLESALDSQIIANGYTTRYGEMPGAEGGYTSPSEREIVISENVAQGSAQAVTTKIHEIAHMMLHCEPEEDGSTFDYAAHRGMAETEAEGTAYVVATYFGIDTSDRSAGYVANWSGQDADQIVKAGTRIMATARKIIDAAEAHMTKAEEV